MNERLPEDALNDAQRGRRRIFDLIGKWRTSKEPDTKRLEDALKLVVISGGRREAQSEAFDKKP